MGRQGQDPRQQAPAPPLQKHVRPCSVPRGSLGKWNRAVSKAGTRVPRVEGQIWHKKPQ